MNRLANSPRLKTTKNIIIRSFPEQINDLILILIFSFKYLFVSKSKELLIVSADKSHFDSVQIFLTLYRNLKKDSTLVFMILG